MKRTIANTLFNVAEIQLSYRSKVKVSLRLTIASSLDAYKILRQYWDNDKIEFVEQFKVLLLNRANKVIGLFDVSTGTAINTVADPKLIFVAALKANASVIIVAHNHPSGNLNPSPEDINFTKELRKAGKFLHIDVLDHIIMTSEAYYSFADKGILLGDKSQAIALS